MDMREAPAGAGLPSASATTFARSGRRHWHGGLPSLMSEPDAQARHEAGVVDVLAVIATEIRGASKSTLTDYADIRSELAGELIAQAQTGLDGAQARTDAAACVVLPVEVELDQRLQDQPIGQQGLVF